MPPYAILILAVLLGAFVGWFFIGPLLWGCKPFTTPAQAARGERKIGSK